MLQRISGSLDAVGRRLEKKQIQIPVDLVAGVLFLIFAVVVLLITPGQVKIAEKDVVNGRAFPTLLMWLMIFCSAALIGKELYKIATKQPVRQKTICLLTEVKALVIFGILVIMYALCRITDLFLTGEIFCCLSFLLYFRCRKRSYYVITLLLAVAIWVAFRFVLGVDF